MYMSNKLVNIYIKTLVSKLKHNNIPNNIDIIFDGGAFNGGMGFGIALYIKELERHFNINIGRISGCSIGSVIALSYLIDINYDINNIFMSMCNNFRKTFNLSHFRKYIKKIIYDNLSDDLKVLDNKLYITYYDTTKYKQIVICKYRNRKHLLNVIMRSCHIPYITSPNMKCQDKYIDGISPYVFADGERPILFIKLVTLTNYKQIFSIGKDYNINPRMLNGINDVNKFFTLGYSDMCSYFNNWSYISVITLRLRLVIVFLILWMLDCYYIIRSYIPDYIFKFAISKNIEIFSQQLYYDILFKVING